MSRKHWREVADMDGGPDVLSDPFVLEDPEGWARFPCSDCDKDLKVGDKVVMVPICGGWLAHPAHHDRRKCRPSAR